MPTLKFEPASSWPGGRGTPAAEKKFTRLFSQHIKTYIAVLIFGVFGRSIYAADVALSWDLSAGAEGYRVYYGLESRNYPFIVDIGLWTQCTISELDIGKTYYISVTAYNESGESDFAGEISYRPNLCELDVDDDSDIDGGDLAEIVADPSVADLSDFVLGFGRSGCDD